MIHSVVMPRHRSMMALRPIQRIKHVVDASAQLAKATQINQVLIRANDAPVLANTTEVITGAKVYGVYVKLEVASNDPVDVGAIPNVYVIFTKNQGFAQATPAPNAVGANEIKRIVLHQEMVMIENKGQGSNARIIFNGVIKIPKGFSRFGPDDAFVMSILSPALDIVFCAQAHYKEFR